MKNSTSIWYACWVGGSIHKRWIFYTCAYWNISIADIRWLLNFFFISTNKNTKLRIRNSSVCVYVKECDLNWWTPFNCQCVLIALFLIIFSLKSVGLATIVWNKNWAQIYRRYVIYGGTSRRLGTYEFKNFTWI